jgi:4-hydroxythreonine-4-phosphate dehydrogenase
LLPYGEGRLAAGKIYIAEAGPKLRADDRDPKRSTRAAGQAQLCYVERAYELVKQHKGAALVIAAVSKERIAHCGLARARSFRGHTEWLQALDGAPSSTMCFASNKLVTALVTTHLPLSRVPRALSPQSVSTATLALGQLMLALGSKSPLVYVCSLNPHAGEGELLGKEEAAAIAPGIDLARKRLGKRARLVGPTGAETAYRKSFNAGRGEPRCGVVAMYHDQATIPMKLVSFGEAVNVTWGLSVVRTSVDHGTAYDIAWRGKADALGMLNAMKLALRLGRGAARR